MEGIQKEENSKLEDKRRKRRNTRLRKKLQLEGGLMLEELDREYSKGLKIARVRTFEEVRGNIFGTTSPSKEETKEDTTIEDFPLNPMRRILELKSSRHVVIDFTEEEGEEKEYKDKSDDLEEENMKASIEASLVGNSLKVITIIYSIKTNREVLEEINALRPKKCSWKSARNTEVARDLIKVGEDYIKEEWYLEGDKASSGG
ncbi:hypothetical protein BGX38DRAFT_1271502 [Terfezia claveryi]|nr:hypothetical protein BGX38DRAFT_1271502 [Terfezia claveryi]